MLRTLSLLLVLLFAAPSLAQEYQSKDLADAAAGYRQELVGSVPANKRQPKLIPRLRRDADAEYLPKRYAPQLQRTLAVAHPRIMEGATATASRVARTP